MTEMAEATREGIPCQDANAESNPQSAQRARSVPPPSPASLDAATQRVRAVRQIHAWMAPRVARATAYLDGQDSLVHAQPPTFARARELHHERAARHNLWVPLRVARLTWGYFHLLIIKPALNFAEWVTETPLRFLGAVLLALIIWHWS